MLTHFNFEQALGKHSKELGSQSTSELKHLFDFDDNLSNEQLKDMMSFLQQSCSKEGLPKASKYDDNLEYELVGYDEFIKKRFNKRGIYVKEINIGARKKISEILDNIESLKRENIAPKTFIDGFGNKWSLIVS